MQIEARKAPEAPGSAVESLAVFFGTHSGTCESIARRFAAGTKAGCYDLDDFAARHAPHGLNIIVTSSYGDGDPPGNAESFAAWLNGGTPPNLRSVKYAVFAVGDRNYADFCGFGRKVDERLAALGAERMAARAECESSKSESFNAWSQPFLSGLGIAPPAVIEKAPAVSHGTSYMLSRRRSLTAPQSSRAVYHLELFDIGEQEHEPGDSIAVTPVNSLERVQRLIAGHGFDEADIVQVRDTPCKLLEVLLFRKELRMLNGTACPAPQALVDALRPMTPRHFSIASHRSHAPHGAHLTVALTEFDVAGEQRLGLASEYLTKRQGIGSLIHGTIRRNPRFRLPVSDAAPIIMVGPGTGVAPFRAFLQARHMTKAKGAAWLFFGNRNRDRDYLYRDEIETFHRNGVLKNLSLAFSRDQDHKIYVQHLMAERGKEVWAWITRGAHIYVCGDAKRMAGDVHSALRQIVAANTRLPLAQCEKFLADLAKKGRYQRDVY